MLVKKIELENSLDFCSFLSILTNPDRAESMLNNLQKGFDYLIR